MKSLFRDPVYNQGIPIYIYLYTVLKDLTLTVHQPKAKMLAPKNTKKASSRYNKAYKLRYK